MKLFSTFLLVSLIAAASAGGCSLFGHSCLGGHGKRADVPVERPYWRPYPTGANPASLMAKSPLRFQLDSSEFLTSLEGMEPVAKEHSRYIDRGLDYA